MNAPLTMDVYFIFTKFYMYYILAQLLAQQNGWYNHPYLLLAQNLEQRTQ